MVKKMKKTLLTVLSLVLFQATVFSEESAWKLKDQADCEVTYQTQLKKLDIGIGIKKEALWNAREFALDELKEYFKNQKHKNFIFVTISKNMLSKTELTDLVNMLYLYFFEAGYKRIVITEARSGLARPVLLDKEVKPEPLNPADFAFGKTTDSDWVEDSRSESNGINQAIPYLIFPGTCEEALYFYKACFDGEILMVMSFDESSLNVSEENRSKIFNSKFQSGNLVFMASDDLPDNRVKTGNNFALLIKFSNTAIMKEVFRKLSIGGEIIFPIQNDFGMLEDKYKIRWMFESTQNKEEKKL